LAGRLGMKVGGRIYSLCRTHSKSKFVNYILNCHQVYVLPHIYMRTCLTVLAVGMAKSDDAQAWR
jgi:hypothetical protein